MGLFDKKPEPGKLSVWTRQPGELARRIEAKAVAAGFLKARRPFTVQDGVRGLLMSQGRLIGELPSGTHDVDGPFRQLLNLLSGEGPTVLLLVDEGDITVDASVGGLTSREGIAAEATVRLTLGLAAPEVFYRNLLKDREAYALAELVEHLLPELRDAVQAFTGGQKIDELFNNAALRDQAAASLRNRLSGSLGRLGFEVIGLSVVELRSAAYQVQRDKAAALELDIRGKGVEKTRREVDLEVHEHTEEHRAAAARATIKTDDSVRQADHDARLKGTLRAHEQEDTAKRLADARLDGAQARNRDRQKDELEHVLEVQDRTAEQKRAQALKDAQAGAAKRGVEREVEGADLEQARAARDVALEGYEKYKAAKAKAEREAGLAEADVLAGKMAAVRGGSTAEMIALGLGDGSALLELERINAQKHMSLHQATLEIERLKADSRLSQAVADQLSERLAEKAADSKDVRDTLERILKETLATNAQVATARAAAQGPAGQTIVAGGAGAPTVINPPQPG